MTFPKLLGTCRKGKGAALGCIRATEQELGCSFPEDYVEVLLESDGCEGLVGNDAYLTFWAASQLVPSSRGYGVAELLPGAVLFGSDGSGDAYGFRMRGDHFEFFAVPFVGMSHDDCRVLGNRFEEMLEAIAGSEPAAPRDDLRVPCPRCGQDWLMRVRLRFLLREVVLCQECDALWPTEADIAPTGFDDYGTFMMRNGRAHPESRDEMAIEGFVLRSTTPAR